ncbi:uncharacterized protein C17orf113-like [Lineus longissimus]|uniref:uncharacterized protein C17orf113-like n=1 Tax=Lineus longissimus TaxID=88925 RepID=UPI00315DAB0F
MSIRVGTIIELERNNPQQVKDEEKWYRSVESNDDMFASINKVIEDEVDVKILNSPFIGVILDETTDVSINKKLNLYVRTVENGRPVVHFFSNVKIPDGKAETIINQLFTQCAAKGLDFAKIISMASDGASVMLGNTTGVGVRFKNANPRLIHIHCVAHRLALAAAQASLVTALDHEAAKPGVAGAGNQKAQGILDKVKSCKFAYLTAFFVDVLPILSKLSKFFQGETVSICGVRPMVTSTTNRLNDFKDEDGVELSRFTKSVDEQDGKYRGIKLTYVNLMPSCKKAAESYIEKVVENIEQRFDPESMNILIDLDKVLNPVHLRGLPAADIRNYGKDSIIEIQGRFGHAVNAQLSVNTDGELTEEEKELPPLIDSKRLEEDYPQFQVHAEVFCAYVTAQYV